MLAYPKSWPRTAFTELCGLLTYSHSSWPLAHLLAQAQRVLSLSDLEAGISLRSPILPSLGQSLPLSPGCLAASGGSVPQQGSREWAVGSSGSRPCTFRGCQGHMPPCVAETGSKGKGLPDPYASPTCHTHLDPR